MMNWDSFIGQLFIVLLVVLVVFLILRELICWYWKINEKVALLKEIRDLLRSQSTAVSQAMQAQITGQTGNSSQAMSQATGQPSSSSGVSAEAMNSRLWGS